MESNILMSVEQRYAVSYQILHAIYRIASSTSTIKDFSAGVLRVLFNSFHASHVTIITRVPNKNEYTRITLDSKRKCDFKLGKKSILNKNEQKYIDECTTVTKNHSIINPLIYINTLGVVIVKRGSSKAPFDDVDLKIMHAICEQLSICIKNFQLYDEQHRTVLGSIKTFTECLGFHTPTSKIEMTFFNAVVVEMAQVLGLTQIQVRDLEYAASLHDAGKFQIPQHLLNKKQPLTSQEKEIIQNHPQKGAELFKDFDALQPVIPIILHHHEKYDGTGYPKGLKKNKIPLEARIMAIMDAFDAMFFGRSYRKEVSLDDCIAELRSNSGTQFDPELIELFVKVIKTDPIRNILKKAHK